MFCETHVENPQNCARGRAHKNVKFELNVMAKIKYTTLYLNLKSYMDHGMRLRKIHRGIRFGQSPLLHPSITMNTNLRAAAKDEMEKDFNKLMNNAVYGKTCENQRKRTDIRLVNDREKAAKLLNKPNCLDVRIFDEKLVRIEMQKVKMLLNKPSYLGFTVLELSKLHMYRYGITIF